MPLQVRPKISYLKQLHTPCRHLPFRAEGRLEMRLPERRAQSTRLVLKATVGGLDFISVQPMMIDVRLVDHLLFRAGPQFYAR